MNLIAQLFETDVERKRRLWAEYKAAMNAYVTGYSTKPPRKP